MNWKKREWYRRDRKTSFDANGQEEAADLPSGSGR